MANCIMSSNNKFYCVIVSHHTFYCVIGCQTSSTVSWVAKQVLLCHGQQKALLRHGQQKALPCCRRQVFPHLARRQRQVPQLHSRARARPPLRLQDRHQLQVQVQVQDMELLDWLNSAFFLVTQPAAATTNSNLKSKSASHSTRKSKSASHSTRKYEAEKRERKEQVQNMELLGWLNVASSLNCWGG